MTYNFFSPSILHKRQLQRILPDRHDKSYNEGNAGCQKSLYHELKDIGGDGMKLSPNSKSFSLFKHFPSLKTPKYIEI